jgi:UDP-GlcNAc:undecaprenyl-phosphate GlcNAc-1-phosphate transferase
MAALLAFAVAFAVVAVATPLAARLATHLGVLDRPGEHKVHARPVPYLGGLAVFAGLAVVLAFEAPRLLLPLALALALGTADDVADLPPVLRLVAAGGVAATAAWAAPAPVRAGPLLTALMVIGLLNAINLLDGLDGLASGVTLASAAGFALLGGSGLGGDRAVALAVVGALAGFLLYNRPPARIFLGDGGAYVLGTALALLAARSIEPDQVAASWAAALLLVAVPIADTAAALARRVRDRARVFGGDRGHLYDRLVGRGWTTAATTLAFVALQTGFAVLAVLVTNVEPGWAIALTTVGAAIVVLLVAVGSTPVAQSSGGTAQ